MMARVWRGVGIRQGYGSDEKAQLIIIDLVMIFYSI